MKLSDIKGERVFDVLADLVEPVANIAQDPKFLEMFRKIKIEEGEEKPTREELRKAAAARLKAGIPYLLKEHKRDLVAVLSTINGVEPEEYLGALNLVKLFRDAADLIGDPDFFAFMPFVQAQKE